MTSSHDALVCWPSLTNCIRFWGIIIWHFLKYFVKYCLVSVAIGTNNINGLSNSNSLLKTCFFKLKGGLLIITSPLSDVKKSIFSCIILVQPKSLKCWPEQPSPKKHSQIAFPLPCRGVERHSSAQNSRWGRWDQIRAWNDLAVVLSDGRQTRNAIFRADGNRHSDHRFLHSYARYWRFVQ